MHKRMAIAAATAVLATAASGCTTRAVSGRSTADEKSRVEYLTTSPAPAAAMWVVPPWTGKVNAESVEGLQWSEDPVPGAAVTHRESGDTHQHPCTIGPAIADGSRTGFLTASHCARGEEAQQQYRIDQQEGTVSPWVPAGDPVSGSDAVPLWSSVTEAVTRIAGRYPITGVLSASAAAELAPGTPICLDGTMSGLTCGTVISNPGSLADLTTTAIGVHGDSGAAVFVVDAAGNAVLVGLHNGGDASTSTVVLLEPVLDALNADVIIDRDTAPATGADYSTRTKTFTY